MRTILLDSDILYEDNHLIAVNKKNNIIVQGDKTGDEPLEQLLKSYLVKKYQKPGEAFVGLIHRLDRPVSGVVLLAKTSKALTRMNNMFKEKQVEKIYWAIVKNKPPEQQDSLVHYMARNRQKNKSVAHDKEVQDSKKASLNYRIIAKTDYFYLLEIMLETGRHHQIRSQLAAISCPVRGDIKYGFSRFNPNGGISLHARKLAFIHPVKKETVEITAPPPADNLWDAFLKNLSREKI